MKADISIHKMEFYAYHGCFPEEQVIGTDFMVDVDMKSDIRDAHKSDSLSETIDYQSVYALVGEEMKTSSKLLEHVAYRIMKAIWDRFEEVLEIRISVSKMNPPLGGKMERVTVELNSTEAGLQR